MNDKTDFSLDLSLNQPLSHEPQVELFAFDECKTYPLPERRLLIRNPNNGKSAIIMPEVLSALTLCKTFRSLEDHIRHVEQGMPALRGQPEQIRSVLGAMIRDGMLVTASSLCASINSAVASGDDQDAPAVVAIITCDRPAALKRLLDSIHEQGGPACFETLYVVDDSRAAGHIDSNRKHVTDFSGQSAIKTEYIGREQQQALMNEAIARNPEHEESIRFLIDFERWKDEWTGGLARNYALLLSLGKRLVMFDDDALFQVYEPQPRPRGVSLSDEIREAEFYEHPGDWPGLKLRKDLDPVKAHLHCLGLPLRKALSRLGADGLSPNDLANATVLQVRGLHANSPVLVSQCGTVGDPGVGNNTWIIELTGKSREKMLAGEETVQRAIRNDNCWVGRRRPHISRRSNMSLITGLDNRKPLPPYFPIQRSEDRLYGIMLSMLFPDAAALDYPWVAPHLPDEDRDRSRKETDFSGKRGFPNFFRDWVLLQAGRCNGSDHDARLQAVAQLFNELANMSDEQLMELYRDEMTRAR
jgi:hypothetical protein